jgi:Cu(I)-responsive transcriptional regulator
MKRFVPPPTVLSGPCTIGEAAEASGVSAKMIRHYESIGLIPSATRTDSNYRLYSSSDVHRLRFIKRARSLGFSMRQIEALLGLWADSTRSSREVKALALTHAAELDVRIREMVEMRDTLTDLARQCRGDSWPDCPILARLADTAAS